MSVEALASREIQSRREKIEMMNIRISEYLNRYEEMAGRCKKTSGQILFPLS